MIRSVLVVLCLAGLSVAHAAPKSKATLKTAEPAPELSLHQQALEESKYEGKAQSLASDAQVSGMLSLKDPRPEVLGRSWSYFAGFTAQQFQPEGYGSNEFRSYDIGKNDSTFMPGLELGFVTRPLATGPVAWKLGVRGKGSFSSQSAEVTLPSGTIIDDARLNTTLLSAGPTVALQWERLSWLALTFSPQFGNVAYTQTSSNNFAKFSKSAGYRSLAYGLDFQVGKKWSLFTEWSQRELTDDSSELALQKDNFELGTKVTW